MKKKPSVLQQLAKHLSTDPAIRKTIAQIIENFKKFQREYEDTDSNVRPWMKAKGLLPPQDFWDFAIWLEDEKKAPIFATEITYELFYEYHQWREKRILKVIEHPFSVPQIATALYLNGTTLSKKGIGSDGRDYAKLFGRTPISLFNNLNRITNNKELREKHTEKARLIIEKFFPKK